MAPEVGFEPTTNRLTADRSTTELLRSMVGMKASRDGDGFKRKNTRLFDPPDRCCHASSPALSCHPLPNPNLSLWPLESAYPISRRLLQDEKRIDALCEPFVKRGYTIQTMRCIPLNAIIFFLHLFLFRFVHSLNNNLHNHQ